MPLAGFKPTISIGELLRPHTADHPVCGGMSFFLNYENATVRV